MIALLLQERKRAMTLNATTSQRVKSEVKAKGSAKTKKIAAGCTQEHQLAVVT
jgi:hypothetical protein